MKRRTFIKYGALATAPLGLTGFNFPLTSRAAQNSQLIMIRLKGGNDGFNTIVPFTNPAYYQLRPNLAIPANELLKLNSNYGLNPALGSLASYFNKGNIQVIHQAAATGSDNSHFTAAITCERRILQSMVPDMQATDPLESIDYVEDDFVEGMKALALTIDKNQERRILSVSLDGFDTHQFQRYRHDLLLGTYAKGMNHLLHALQANRSRTNTTVITWSEFGRQLQENSRKGTEHGDSNLLLVYS